MKIEHVDGFIRLENDNQQAIWITYADGWQLLQYLHDTIGADKLRGKDDEPAFDVFGLLSIEEQEQAERARRYNREMDARMKALLEAREKPWLPGLED